MLKTHVHALKKGSFLSLDFCAWLTLKTHHLHPRWLHERVHTQHTGTIFASPSPTRDRAAATTPKVPDLQCGHWFPLPSLAALAAGGKGTSFLPSIVRVRACLLWCIIVVVGAMLGQINLPQFYSHTGGDLHGGVSELVAMFSCRSFRSVAWSSRCSSDLARSISWHVAGVRHYLRRCWGSRRGGCSRARMLVQRWWIYHYSPASSMGCGGSWSKAAWGRSSVDVPQWHVPRCLQRIYSSTHKALLAMVVLLIWQWMRLDVSSNVCLGGVRVWQRPLVPASVEKSRMILYFSIL
jgi:hypothetical protein